MLIIKSGKWENLDEIEQPNQESIKMIWEKKNYKYLGIFEVDTFQTSETERKNKKKATKINKKTRNEALVQKSYHRDKHLCSNPCRKFRTFLKTNKGRTKKNRPKNKEIYEYEEGLISERWHR